MSSPRLQDYRMRPRDWADYADEPEEPDEDGARPSSFRQIMSDGESFSPRMVDRMVPT